MKLSRETIKILSDYGDTQAKLCILFPPPFYFYPSVGIVLEKQEKSLFEKLLKRVRNEISIYR